MSITLEKLKENGVRLMIIEVLNLCKINAKLLKNAHKPLLASQIKFADQLA